MQLVDSFGRHLNYLRISLTDRCNFRCVYCMPPEGIPLVPREEILRMAEYERLIRIFVSLGVKKIRLTGGEPLLRKKVVSLVSHISSLEKLSEIALTTNGSFLAGLAGDLKKAGLSGVNISIDSLDKKRFARVTRTGRLEDVLKGLYQSIEVGLKVKVNVVALSDLTKREVFNFCELAIKYPLEVRFIEFMPLCGSGWNEDLGLTMKTLLEWIRPHYELIPFIRNQQVSINYKINGAEGILGFIPSMTEPFCGTCNRLRLTAFGTLRLCLFSHKEVDLKGALRKGASDEEIEGIIEEAIYTKPKGREEMSDVESFENLPKIRTLGG